METLVPWSAEAIEAALEEARGLVRSDGADLELIEVNEKAARIIMKLDVDNASCATGTCVMPGEILQRLVIDILVRHLPGELELQFVDPRRG